MKMPLKNKVIALTIAVLLVVSMAPAAYAASSDRALVKFEKKKVSVPVGQTVSVAVNYESAEAADYIDSNNARVSIDNSKFATVQFGSDNMDTTSVEVTGVADGETVVYVTVRGDEGRYYGQLLLVVGRGNRTEAQIKREEAAKKAEEDLIKNDTSELGKALTEALKTATKREVMISTTSSKNPAIPLNTIKVLAAKASLEKKYAVVRITTSNANGVLARMYMDPAGLTTLKTDFKTGISIDTSRKASLGSNYIASVKFAHTGSFGSFMEVAAKVSGPKDADTIAVYNVDANGKLQEIEEPSCSWDKDGLLHFYTRNGGEVVLMKGRKQATEAKTKDEVVEIEAKSIDE